MNRKFRFLAILMMLLAAFVFTGCDGNAADGLFDGDNGGDDPTPPTTVAVESVSLNKTKFTITVGDQPVQLTATVAPDDATITVTTVDGSKTATCGVTVKAALPAGALAGVFTVDTSGKTVHFSKGNLYWNGSEYQFEAKQCDYRHYNGKTNDKAVINGTTTTTPSGTVGSLFWLKSTETAIKPYDASYGTPSPNNDTNDIFFAANGGAISGWDVLSSEEWDYLLNIRTGAASKVGYGTVCGVRGIILLPDVFTDPMKNNGTGAFVPKATTGWTANEYTTDNWAAMEAAGAVFLPATGYRGGSSVNGVNLGNYWSATPIEGSPNSACNLLFGGSGRSVRLVW